MNVDALLERLDGIPWLEYEFWGNNLARWLVAAGVALFALLAMKVVLGISRRRALQLTRRTATGWDDSVVETLEATKGWFLLIIALYFGSLVLVLTEHNRDILQSIAILALLLQVAIWGSKLLKYGIEYYLNKRRDSDPALATTVSAMSFVGNLILWSVVVLLALDNVGIDVTALVAGLGVGGIAVALAAQNILGDLFASLSIIVDKPFVLGDFIVVGDKAGTIEKIGLKTTRARALSGEQLIFANTDLLQSRIHNYKRMRERRIAFTIGVTYETPVEQLEAIPGMIREMIESQELVRFDRAHFKGFGDFSLNYEIVYYVLSSDYAQYMDVQQSINLALCRRFAEQGIEFAYPTQKLFLARDSDG